MDKSQEDPRYMWNMPKILEDLIQAWTTLLQASEALEAATMAKGEAWERAVNTWFALQGAEYQDSPFLKAAKRLTGLYLSSETRTACGRASAAQRNLEVAEYRYSLAKHTHAQALAAYQEAKAAWDWVCAATREAKARQMLGVSDEASPDEIRQAYREAAKRCHPDRADRNGMSTEFAADLFRQVNDAYELLKGKS